MENPLKDQPDVETVDENKEDLPPHLSGKRKHGEPNPDGSPYDFTFEKLQIDNPVKPGSPPEELIKCTVGSKITVLSRFKIPNPAEFPGIKPLYTRSLVP